MTQLIPQSKIDEAAKNLSINRGLIMSHTVHIAEKSFESGVQFSLNEIQPLMVEFLEWCNDLYSRNRDNTWGSMSRKTTQQLLEEFINSKNK